MSEIFGYVILVALLVGLAAASVERLLAEVHAPRRFAWLGAFAAALTAPPVFWLLTDATPALPTTSVGAISVEPFAAVALIDWDTALLWLWIITTTVLVMLYVAAWYRLALLAKRWRSETSDAASIVVADDLGPAVLGVLRPRVVLPRWLMDAPAAVRTTVVAHELEHIAARDQACIVAAQVVTILLPWNLLCGGSCGGCARRSRSTATLACYSEAWIRRNTRTSCSPSASTGALVPISRPRSSSPSPNSNGGFASC